MIEGKGQLEEVFYVDGEGWVGRRMIGEEVRKLSNHLPKFKFFLQYLVAAWSIVALYDFSFWQHIFNSLLNFQQGHGESQ